MVAKRKEDAAIRDSGHPHDPTPPLGNWVLLILSTMDSKLRNQIPNQQRQPKQHKLDNRDRIVDRNLQLLVNAFDPKHMVSKRITDRRSWRFLNRVDDS
ncbi:hypothetical protein U1Q18_002782 [Sarracenia purpurea var. burkii]